MIWTDPTLEIISNQGCRGGTVGRHPTCTIDIVDIYIYILPYETIEGVILTTEVYTITICLDRNACSNLNASAFQTIQLGCVYVVVLAVIVANQNEAVLNMFSTSLSESVTRILQVCNLHAEEGVK